MKKDQKLVDNYQYDESAGYTEDGVDINIATHVVTKEMYLLKKVSLRDTAERAKQKNLINQVNNLKLISSPLIAECQKMLKTPNNIYLVYDYSDGSTLEEILNSESALSQADKETIASKIVEALRVMARAHVVHTNLTPRSIVVTKNHSIKVMNFVYSHHIEGRSDMPCKFKPPNSKYVAPEVTEGNVHISSDLYSLGVILGELGLDSNSSQLSIEASMNPGVITRLLFEKPSDRPSLEEIASSLSGPKGSSSISREKSSDTKSKSSKSPLSKTNIKKAASFLSEREEILTNRSNEIAESKQNYKIFTQHVLKRRNLAIFTLQLAEVCLNVEDGENRQGLLVGLLLFRKSTMIITHLLGFLNGQKGCENQIDDAFFRPYRRNFEKKSDFMKLSTTIHKEAATQKRMLEELEKSIIPELNPQMQEPCRANDIDNALLREQVIKYLANVVTMDPEELESKTISKLYLMSEIVVHESYERMFEELVNEEKIILQDQLVYTHAHQRDKRELLREIAERLKSL